MVAEIVLAVGMLAALFILFLVLSKSMGNIDNYLYKLEYLIRKECDLKLEGLEKKYTMRAADKKFDEMYSIRRVDDDAAKGNEDGKKADEVKNKTDETKKDGNV